LLQVGKAVGSVSEFPSLFTKRVDLGGPAGLVVLFAVLGEGGAFLGMLQCLLQLGDFGRELLDWDR
jgi:hypothetical protein